MVSGAIALIHDRWPWLKNFPHETVDIILESAKDLGAPGTDAVYGRGLLDVEASPVAARLQPPRLVHGRERPEDRCSRQQIVVNTYQGEKQTAWDANGRLLLRLRAAGPAGHAPRLRDPAVVEADRPERHARRTASQEQFQAYLLGRMDDWAAARARGSASGANGFAPGSMAVANPWGADMTVAFAPRHARFGFRDEGPAYQSNLHHHGERTSGHRRLRRRRAPAVLAVGLHPGRRLRRRARRGQPAAGPGLGRRPTAAGRTASDRLSSSRPAPWCATRSATRACCRPWACAATAPSTTPPTPPR